MSFDVICSNCGAPSGPSVGICPFCKSPFSGGGSKISGKESPTLTKIKKYYDEGLIERALNLIRTAEREKPKLLNNANFVLLYVKILLEVDGPTSKINSLLSKALLDKPSDPLLIEYLEIADARSKLSNQVNDPGELELANVIRRSPKNVHALFLLGSHLFWVEGDTQRSLKYLEACHRWRPNFLRAAACLAAIYKKLGLDSQASRLFRHCASLESNKEMKAYFKSLT